MSCSCHNHQHSSVNKIKAHEHCEHGHGHEHCEHEHGHGHCGHEHGRAGKSDGAYRSHENQHSGCGCCGHGKEHGKELAVKFILSALFFASGIAAVLFSPEFKVTGNFGFSALLFVISWFIAGYSVIAASAKNILKGRVFDENFLMSVATIGAFFLGEWGEAAAVMLFYNLGELIQHSIVEKSRSNIIKLMDVRPDFARIYKNTSADNFEFSSEALSGSGEIIVNPAEVKIGSFLLIKPGEKIPLDGIITAGSADLDTSSITGEGLPRAVKEGSEVLAGFVNLNGLLAVKTTALAENTAVAKMLQLIESSQSKKAKTEKLITSFAKVYTPIVTGAAVLLAVLPPLVLNFFAGAPINGVSSFSPWIYRSLVFLVISCPCAFILSVPLGYFGGIGGCAKRGILVKGADYIDALAKTRGVILDKTGTLTTGKPEVLKILPASAGEEKEFLKKALLAEYNSNHPIARAIKKYAEEKLSGAGTVLENFAAEELKQVEDYNEKAGYGVSMKFRGKDLAAGSKLFIESILKGNIPQTEACGTCVHLAYGNAYLGAIILGDSVKQGSKEAIQKLKKLGITHIEMFTGDTAAAAKKTAEDLGIEKYKAELLPHEKVDNFVKIAAEIKSEYKKASVLFSGDGINDAPVLAAADAGIAMGGLGSDAAIEAADVVLMDDNPCLVPEGIKLARFTRAVVAENIFLSFAIKAAFLVLGAAGIAGLKAAVFADVGVALLALFNSLRLRK